MRIVSYPRPQLALQQIETREQTIATLRDTVQQHAAALKAHAAASSSSASSLSSEHVTTNGTTNGNGSSNGNGNNGTDLIHAVGASERARIVAAAHDQIKSLQLLLDQKTKSMAAYQQLLAEQQEAFAAEKARDQAELQRLHERVLSAGDEQQQRMREAMAKIEQMPLRHEEVVSAEAVRERLEAKDRYISLGRREGAFGHAGEWSEKAVKIGIADFSKKIFHDGFFWQIFHGDVARFFMMIFPDFLCSISYLLFYSLRLLSFRPFPHTHSPRQLALAMVEAERSQRVADEARALVARGDDEMKRARAQVRVCGWCVSVGGVG
jgi:hypothetical protein